MGRGMPGWITGHPPRGFAMLRPPVTIATLEQPGKGSKVVALKKWPGAGWIA